MIGGFRTPGANPTVSTTSTSLSQRPIEWPARVRSMLAGCSFIFMWIVRVKPSWPYCSVIVSAVCVMRSTGPSKVQSNRILVVSHRMRGFSGLKLWNASAAFLPASVNVTRGRNGGRLAPPGGALPPGGGALAPGGGVPGGGAPGVGPSPGLNSPTLLTGTSAPARPRGSVITICSGAQSPFRFGSPVGSRAARGAAACVAAAAGRWFRPRTPPC